MRIAVSDLDAAPPRGWWVECTVRARSEPHHYSADDPGKCVRTTVLYDDTGEIALTCFDEAAERLCRDAVGTLVRVSGATVRAADPRYPQTRHAFDLSAGRATVVRGIGAGRPPVETAGDVVGRVASKRTWRAAFGDATGSTLEIDTRDGRVVGDCAVDAPVGAAVLVRGAARHGGRLLWARLATLHVLGQADASESTDEPDAPVDRVCDVERLVRDGQASVRVRALLTWHSALDGWRRPRAWSGAAKRARRDRLRVRFRLADASGTVDVWAEDDWAARVLGVQHAELVAMPRQQFDEVAAAPLFRWIEWTVEGRPNTDDESVYLRVGGATRATFSAAQGSNADDERPNGTDTP